MREREESDGEADKNASIYVGNLNFNVTDHDVISAFDQFGTVKALHLRPGSAFLEYEDHRGAREAVRIMDGR